MDRAGEALFNVCKRVLQALLRVAVTPPDSILEGHLETRPQLRRALARERHGSHFLDLAFICRKEGYHAVHHARGLARSRGRFHEHGGIEFSLDTVAFLLIG
jgi:hypothetical protein